MQLEDICLEVSVFRQRARLSVALHKCIGANPVEKILPAIPRSKNNIRIAIVDGPQDLIRNKSFHLVHQTGSLSKHFLKSVRILRLHIKAIGNSYHKQQRFGFDPDGRSSVHVNIRHAEILIDGAEEGDELSKFIKL